MISIFKKLLVLVMAIIMLPLSAGCGGGGSSVSQVKGILTDGFGSIISRQEAVITLDGTSEVAHPGADGSFVIAAEPGKYVLRGTLTDIDGGFLLEGAKEVILTAGQTLDVGTLAISQKSLENGWTAYRNGKYTVAESIFRDYLDAVRSAQANLGSSSAYSGLGWTRARGLNNPVKGAADFEDAIDGWSGNTDAWVGLAGCELSMMKYGGGFHFNQALSAITAAIDTPGLYTSASTHDQISEVDLKAYRSFINFLNGNLGAAGNEAIAIENQVITGGNRASSHAVSLVKAFID